MTTYLPVPAALKALAAAGHKVQRISKAQAQAAGYPQCVYLVDGLRCDITMLRNRAAKVAGDLRRPTA